MGVKGVRQGGRQVVVGVNDLKTIRPDLMLDWDWELNTKDPTELMRGSSYTAYWICHECGHKWSCRLDSRTQNMHGCPMCSKGGGSSVNDYTLYKLLEMSLDCEVLYRYNVLTGCEADVYIPSMKIAIEYDGYGFHKYEEKQQKDKEKEERLKAEGIRVCRFIERQDRNGSVVPNGDVIYVPEMTYDRFEELKETLVAGVILWGIINKEDIPEEFYSLSLNEVRTKTSKPVYQKSLKRYLDDRGDVFWDYDKNGSLLPEDIFASILKLKVNYKCKYGHEFESTPNSIKKGYGCPVCSGHRTADVPLIEKMYNLAMLFKIPNEVYSDSLMGERLEYICPFCGDKSIRTFRSSVCGSRFTEYCSCLEGVKVYLTVLGVGLDKRIYYCVNIEGRFFLGVSDDIESDILLSKVFIGDEYFNDLNEERFKGVVGDPYIISIKYNSFNSIPINKKKVLVEVRNSEEDIDICYKRLEEQKLKGLKQSKGKEKVALIKSDIRGRLKVIFEHEFNTIFALNRTVDGINRDLICRQLNLSLIIRVNIVKEDVFETLQYWFDERKNDGFVYVTDIPEFVDEDNGFFYLSRVQNKDELEDVFKELGNKICNYWRSLGSIHLFSNENEDEF